MRILPDGLQDARANPPFKLLEAQQCSDIDLRAFVEPIVWGWKRDAPDRNLGRLIFFSARNAVRDSGWYLEEPFFFYAHWGPRRLLERLASDLAAVAPDIYAETTSVEAVALDGDRLLLRIVSGRPIVSDLVKLMRLAARHPETPRATPPSIERTTTYDLQELGIRQFDVLAGSGLSYESQLPMLKNVHDLFFVDDGYDGFCLGDQDPLPSTFAASFSGLLERWASWHVAAARAKPSVAHSAIAQLRVLGVVDRVFTDMSTASSRSLGLTTSFRSEDLASSTTSSRPISPMTRTHCWRLGSAPTGAA